MALCLFTAKENRNSLFNSIEIPYLPQTGLSHLAYTIFCLALISLAFLTSILG
jgi:hypothetical protein